MNVTPVWASITTVRCDDPRGFQIAHGKDYRDKPNYHSEDVAEQFGSRPLFVIDSTDRNFITVIWDGAETFGKELAEKYSPANAVKAQIVYRNRDQISAVEPYPGGVYVHSLYPRLGYGVFTKQGHWTSGETASAWIYFAPCTFSTQ